VDVVEGSGGGTRPVTFLITLDKVSSTDVTVTYTIYPGSADRPEDFRDGPISGTITIPAGYIGFSMTQYIVEDTLVEGNENFTIVLSNPIGATLLNDTATVTIVDDDFPVFTLSGDEAVVEGAAASYVITLTGASLAAGQSVTFNIGTGLSLDAATEGVDYNSKDGTLTVTAPVGGWAIGAQVATFTVQTTDDTLYEGDETFTVQLTGSSIGTASGTVVTTILDNDQPTVSVAVAPAEVAEDGTPHKVNTITLSNANTISTTVTYTI
jgi:hypothetical protein